MGRFEWCFRWLNRFVFLFHLPFFILSPLMAFGAVLSEDKPQGYFLILLAIISSFIVMFSFKIDRNFKKRDFLAAFQYVKRILILVGLIYSVLIVSYLFTARGASFFILPSLIMTWHYVLWFLVDKKIGFVKKT